MLGLRMERNEMSKLFDDWDDEMTYDEQVKEIKRLKEALRMSGQTNVELNRKYRDMHNLATQAMSRVHELEKKVYEK